MVDMASPYNALISANMQPGQNPLTTMQQMSQAATGMAQADDASLANAQNHLAYKIQALTPLLAKGANVTQNDVATAGANAVADSKGVVSSDEMAHFIGQLPSDGPGIQAALQRQQLRLIGAQQQIATLRGENSDVQTGGGTQFGLRNSFTGQRTPQAGPNGYVGNEPGVGLTEGPSVMTPSGPQKTVATQKQMYDLAQGKARVVNGQIVYGNGGGAPAPAAAPPTAAVNPATLPPRAAVAPAQPLPADGKVPAPVGALVPVGAPAGAAGAADVASQDSARQGQALLSAADQVPNAQATIANMRADLDKFTSGPLAGRLNNLKKGVNQITDIVGAGPMFDKQSISSQENFNKQAEALAQQSFAALGGTGTDKQLASAHGSNPNDALSGLGNKQILPMLEGLQDAVQAKAAAWQKWRSDPSNGGDASYGAFSTDFNRGFSPRAFQFVRMSPDQRQDLVKSMTPAERKQLGSALQNAESRGWIKPGG